LSLEPQPAWELGSATAGKPGFRSVSSARTMFLSCLLLPQEMNGEFQFLLCDRCHSQVLDPILLPCLHNLCSQCHEENKPIGLCIICGTPYSHSAEIPKNPDHVFFANLQFKFSPYQKVTGNQRLVCENCAKDPVWNSNQKSQTLPFLFPSLYCKQYNQSMCTICALLDSEHMGQLCNISQEIQCRQDELQNMSVELKEKKNAYDKSYSSHEELVRNMVRLRNETQELIQQKIEEMIQILQEKGEGYLAEVEAHHNHQVQEVKKKLQEMDGVFQRITSSQRLVEKLHLYVSGQEVLEIHPFLRKSMMELRRKQPSTAEGVKVKNFLETKSQLQNLLERVTNNKGKVLQSGLPFLTIGISVTKQHSYSASPSSDRFSRTRGRNFSSSEKQQIPPLAGSDPACSLTLPHPVTSHFAPPHNTLSGCLLVLTTQSLGISCILNFVEKHVQVHRFHSSTWTKDVSLFIAAGNSLHLVVLGDKGTVFHVMISYQENSRERVSVFGMDEILQYLSSLQMPILVGYKLWSMDIPALLDALQEINKELQFEEPILGFSDALPLIREKFPDISKYTLKNLDRKYLCGKLDHTNTSNCVRILMKLCTRYEINKEFSRIRLIACSSFRCYSSLQLLLRERVLSVPSVQTLALHNISLDTLQCIYLSDPKKGLKKLCRHLNTNHIFVQYFLLQSMSTIYGNMCRVFGGISNILLIYL
uniref:RING-type domain-containing protein n=1 Tax=Laticauda laticaudata TaxID=8630 RepID=A0A8C5RYI1_LATLA